MTKRASAVLLMAAMMVMASSGGVEASTRHRYKSSSGTTTPTTTPTVPTTVNVLVNWSAPVARTDGGLLDASELASFDIYYFDDLTGSIRTVHVSDPSLRQLRITALPKSTTYHFSVVTTDVNGSVSDASEAFSIAL